LPAEGAPSLVLVEDLPGVGRHVTLPEDESHYLMRVCRARLGDRVSATDGRGALATLRVVAGGRAAVVEVEACDRSERTREAWVLSGPPEGERGDWMIEKLAELGVAVFQPLDCERGGWDRMKGRAERRFLVEIRDPLPVAEALAGLPAEAGRWVGDAAGAGAATLSSPGTGLAIGLIGPSSGFSESERELVAGGRFTAICLSDSRLRTETAALAWACWWSGAVPRPPAAC
jgi:16S rRNA (uracil1498-N3)-methyltransferase